MRNAKKHYRGFLGGQLFLVISMPLSYAQEKKGFSCLSQTIVIKRI